MTDAERKRRIYHHLYETNEGIAEQSERIVKLEELVADMYKFMSIAEELNAHIRLAPSETRSFAYRMRELGIEVDG